VINNDQEFQTTMQRIQYFQQQVAKLRQVETNLTNYRLSVGGYLAELDRMNLEVREYLWSLPATSQNELAAVG
jgi:prefoldin subunit 5